MAAGVAAQEWEHRGHTRGTGGELMTLYGYVIMFFFLGYLVSFVQFTDYLRRFHRGTYVDLGEPGFPTYRSLEEQRKLLLALVSLWGFIFSSAHAQLGDSRLSLFVWWMRFIIVGCLLVGLFFLS
jgi:hypothetical protein